MGGDPLEHISQVRERIDVMPLARYASEQLQG
jgi:hypothetical protein